MAKVFIDTNIPMYAGGAEHSLRAASRRVVLAVANGTVDAVTDAEVFQEILYRFSRIDQRDKGFAIFDAFYRVMLGRVLPVDAIDTRNARDLAERHRNLSARDLIHLAIIVRHQIPTIVSADVGFDGVPDVRRIPPTEFAG